MLSGTLLINRVFQTLQKKTGNLKLPGKILFFFVAQENSGRSRSIKNSGKTVLEKNERGKIVDFLENLE